VGTGIFLCRFLLALETVALCRLLAVAVAIVGEFSPVKPHFWTESAIIGATVIGSDTIPTEELFESAFEMPEHGKITKKEGGAIGVRPV
jgi:hypothetical protein